MQHAKSLLLVIATIAALGGCAPSYRTTLEQKLDGKTPSERRVTLAQECGAEIAKDSKVSGPANQHHFENMKLICEKMTGEHVSTDPDAAQTTN
jgi:hypothetical protein